MIVPVLGFVLLVPSLVQQNGTYRSSFDMGLEALEAGRGTEAVELFLEAGALAPDAPLWRAYLARARGEEPGPPTPLQVDLERAWELVSPGQTYDVVFDSTGDRLVSGRNPATLWDARSGNRIAVLSHRHPWGALRFWRFDETGRLLVGVSGEISGQWGSEDEGLEWLDIRNARTGDPVLVPDARDAVVTRDTQFEWVPGGTAVRNLQLGTFFEMPYEAGLLRYRVVPTRVNEDFLMRPDRRRALFLHRQMPTELRLVDPRTEDTLATVQPGGGQAWFSPNGMFVISENRFPPELFLLDAETGERLQAPPLPDDREYHMWGAGFLRDHLVVVDRDGEVVFWDPREAAVVRRLQLQPPPRQGVDQIAFGDAGRCLIVHTFGTSQGYDTYSGRELWTCKDSRSGIGQALSRNGLRLATRDGSGTPNLIDVRTGEPPAGYAGESLQWAKAVETLFGAEAALLTLSDGSLRRVDLETGATTALAEEHGTTEEVSLRQLNADRLVSWVEGTRLYLRDSHTLEPIHQVELEAGSSVLAVAPDGMQIVVRSPEDLLQLRTLSESPQAFMIRPNREHPVSAAYSPDGSRWAVAYEGHVHLFETTTRAPVSDFVLRGAKVRNPDPMRFYGEDRLAIGYGIFDRGRLGVNLYQLPDGERIARLDPLLPLVSGGRVSDLRCDVDIGMISFALVSTGYVAAFKETDWNECWNIDYGGGNPSPLSLQRSGESNRIFVSGMSLWNARVRDATTGEEVTNKALDCLSLSGTFSDRFAVGLRDRALVVFEGDEFTELYERREGLEGTAWVVRDGVRLRLMGPSGPSPDPLHLESDGISRPIDCWDAWLHDPLELLPVPLDALPDPPRIVSGPPRQLEHAGDTLDLTIEVADDSTLLGVEVEVRGRDVRLVRLPPEPGEVSAPLTVAIRRPWPADVCLRAVDRNGVRSAPWRVRITRPVETPRDR